jgi:ATP-binding cassette, subfamily B, bacterial PglK
VLRISGISNYLHQVKSLLGDRLNKIIPISLLFIVLSLIDVIGIGLVAPYVSILFNAEQSGATVFILNFLSNYGISSSNAPLFLGWVIVIVFALKAVFAIFINYIILRFCYFQGAIMRSQLIVSYQKMPYEFHLSRNSSVSIRNIELATAFSQGILQSILKTISESIVGLAIVLYLFSQDFVVMSLLMLVLGLLFILYDYGFKNKIRKYGSQANKMLNNIVKTIQEAIRGIVDIKILQREIFFRERLEVSSNLLSEVGVKASLIGSSPRYLVEFSIILFVVSLVTIYSLIGISAIEIMPIISMFGIAAVRLAPISNQIISGLAKIRKGRNTVSLLYDDLCILNNFNLNVTDNSLGNKSFKFKSFRFSNVSFMYKNSSEYSIKSASFQVNKGDYVAFIGKSGSGKTTLINVLIGLLEPQNGEIFINDMLMENVSSITNKIAYLPQSPFLLDASLKNNIALGMTEEEIDLNLLNKCIDRAKLLDLVKQSPDGINLKVGENGSLLSGGQRQRVVLARAFYFKREIIVMDESTSALDKITEDQIMNEITLLKGDITIIIITHKENISNCADNIYALDDGKITQIK